MENGSFNHLPLNCSIPGCKFGGFAKNYDLYNDSLKQGILTNNGRPGAVMTPKWDWSDWSFLLHDRKNHYEDCSINEPIFYSVR